MVPRRWHLIPVVAAVLSAACDESLRCEEKGGVEKNGACTCPAGRRPDDSGEHCIPAEGDGAPSDSSVPAAEHVDRDSGPERSQDAEAVSDAQTMSDSNSGNNVADATPDTGTGQPVQPDTGPPSDSGTTDATTADAGSPDAALPTKNVILDLSMDLLPSSIAVGKWPAEMRTGHWRFTWTPSFPSTALDDDGDGYIVLFQFGGTGDTADQIWLEKQGTNCKAWVNTMNGVLLSIQSLVFSAGQPITYELDLPRGSWTVSGATAGNGTLTKNGGFSFPDGTLFVGRSGKADTARFVGTLSNVEVVP